MVISKDVFDLALERLRRKANGWILLKDRSVMVFIHGQKSPSEGMPGWEIVAYVDIFEDDEKAQIQLEDPYILRDGAIYLKESS